MRKVVLFISDTHGGSKYGLLNPATRLDRCTYGELGVEHNYWKPGLTKIQKLLWKFYKQDIKGVVEWAKGDEIVVVHNGDVTDGDKHPNAKVDELESSQVRIAAKNMEPWFEIENLTKFILVDGTSAHNYGDGSATDLVSRELLLMNAAQQLEGKREVKISRLRHGVLNADGCRIDVAHHGPGVGKWVWLRGYQLQRYARNICMDEMLDRKPAPDVIVRSHYHSYEHEAPHVKDHDCFIMVTPCYTGMNHYASQVTASSYKLSIGMVAIEIIDGERGRVKDFVRTLDLRQEIKI